MLNAQFSRSRSSPRLWEGLLLQVLQRIRDVISTMFVVCVCVCLCVRVYICRSIGPTDNSNQGQLSALLIEIHHPWKNAHTKDVCGCVCVFVHMLIYYFDQYCDLICDFLKCICSLCSSLICSFIIYLFLMFCIIH